MSTKMEVTFALELSSVWKEDRYGHFQTMKGTQAYRLKMQDLSVRFEKRVMITGKAEWLNVVSDYYKNVSVGEREGKLVLRIGNKALPL